MTSLHEKQRFFFTGPRAVAPATPPPSLSSPAKFASLFLKTAHIMQQTGRKTCTESGLSKNFEQAENEPEIFTRGMTCSQRRPNFTVWNTKR